MSTAPARLARPQQRIGHIGDHDNRFCGAAVFGELAQQIVDPFELVARACGVSSMTPADRDVVRLMALSLTSPDARVWPLKLARTLASYGNPVAGLYGAQLVSRSVAMGPGAHAACAASLVELRRRLGDHAGDAAVREAVAAYSADHGRLAGFGVPLRPRDERLLALHVAIEGHDATRRPFWRLSLRVAAAVTAKSGVEPNVVLPLSALMLDLGLPAHRCGVFASMMLGHVFAAHAIDAAEHDGPWLQRLPDAAIDDRSPPLRRSPAAEAEVARAAASRGPGSNAPRRSLPW